MMAYYGGRTEVRVRRQPVRVAYLDFTSMYPTTYALYNMDRYLKADRIKPRECTEDVQLLLNRVSLEDVIRKDFWPGMVVICKIRPDDDVLPIRATYGKDQVYTIGVNHVKSNGPTLWYALPDLIASKFLSGKVPIIDEAIIFEPEGLQDDLQSVEILPGVTVSPGEDFIKKLIEERLKIKKQMKVSSGDERHQLDLRQNILKIVANSTSYGIFIEANANPTDGVPIKVYGGESFETTASKQETMGRAFNPVIAVFLTSGSRLILAAAEALVGKNGGEFVYCDTDSIFITPGLTKLVQDFFRPLNPYSVPMEMFKVEDDDEGRPLDDVWFYGISAKRYVLYDRDTNSVIVRKYSSHGLGGLV
jgi:DNA polymerase elongation subunit (family B)